MKFNCYTIIFIICLFTVFCFSSGIAAEVKITSVLEGKWTVFLNVSDNVTWDTIPETMRDKTGKEVHPVSAKMKDESLDFIPLGKGSGEGSIAVAYNTINVTEACAIKAGFAADWWMEVWFNGKKVYDTLKKGNESPAFQPDDHLLTLQARPGKNILAVKVISGSAGWRLVCGNPSATQKTNIRFEENKQWKPVDFSNIRIIPASALDQSTISALPFLMPANTRPPRLGVGANGRLTAAGWPGKQIRLHGFNVKSTWLIGLQGKSWPAPDGKELKEFIRICRAQGYNLIRLHGAVDALSPDKPMAINPHMLDRLDRFLAELGKEGMYLHLTIFAYNFNLPKQYWWKGDHSTYKSRMLLGDEFMRRSFAYTAKTILNHVNPYTGLAWKDDPAIAVVEPFNEIEFGAAHLSKMSPELRETFNVRFRNWLKSKYSSAEELSTAWKWKKLKSFADTHIPSEGMNGCQPANYDFTDFCTELATETSSFCMEAIRQSGYTGLTAQFSLPLWFGDNIARFKTSPVIIQNTYFNHPTSQGRIGSQIRQVSSITTGGDYWYRANATRFADRPFIITEFNHPFWGRYQYECGLLFGAYSALQGFDGLTIHESAAMLDVRQPNGPFTVGSNPVARAGEFLAACLYLRQDIKTSPHRVRLDITKAWVDSGFGAISGEQASIGLMTGFSMTFPWIRKTGDIAEETAPDLRLSPSSGAAVKAADWSSEATDLQGKNFSLAGFVRLMRQKGLLQRENISDPTRRIFQSDTGELTMRCTDKSLSAITALTEAIAAENPSGMKMNCLTIESCNTPALVAACSIDTDRKPLKESRRIVLIFSTETANTGMELSHDRSTLLKTGSLPVLMKTGILTLDLNNENAGKLSLYALGMNGARKEALPCNASGTHLKIVLNTAELKKGITPFFELCAE